MAANPDAIRTQSRASTFEFWFTPVQAIGLAIFLANLWVSFAHADETRIKQPPARAACIACNGSFKGPGKKRLIVEPTASKLGELLSHIVVASPRPDRSALPGGFAFRVEQFISSIELNTSGSQRQSVYLIPGMHWRAADTARFGFGVASGSESKVEDLAVLAAFTVQFK